MLYSNDVLNGMKQLRQRFRDEGIGLLRLQAPDLLENILQMTIRSRDEETRALATTVLNECGMQINPEILERLTKPVKTLRVPRLYRGQPVRSSAEEQENPAPLTIPSERVYRGQKTG